MTVCPKGYDSLLGAICYESFLLWSTSRLGFVSLDSRGCPGPGNPVLEALPGAVPLPTGLTTARNSVSA